MIPDALAASKDRGPRCLVASSNLGCEWVRNREPADSAAAVDGRRLKDAFGQTGVLARRVPVKVSVLDIFGEVDEFTLGVNSGRLVAKDSHRWVGAGWGLTRRVALPHHASGLRCLLARQESAPRRGSAAAVSCASFKN